MPVDRPDFDAVSEADIAELIATQVPEGLRWDYKRDLYGNSDADKREALKDISSFANSSGGHLLIGVEEHEGIAVGVPGIAGVDPDQVVQRLDQLVRGGLEPRPLGVRVRAVRLGSGSYCFIVRIPKSWHAPHRVSAHGSNRFWLRNSAGCHEASVEELRGLFTQGGDALYRARQFRDQRISEVTAGRGIRPLQGGGRLVLHIVPVASVMGQINVRAQDAYALQDRLVPMSAMGFTPRYNFHGFVSERGGDLNHGYTQVFRDGKVEATKAGIVSTRNDGTRRIPAMVIERSIFNALPGYLDALKRLDVATPLIVLVTLEGVEGAYYACSNDYEDPPIPLDGNVVELPECYIDDFGAAVDYQKALRPAIDALWNSAGFESANTFDAEGRWTILR